MTTVQRTRPERDVGDLAAAPARRRPGAGATRLAPWALAAVLVLGWQLTIWLADPPAYVLPAPGAVAARLADLLLGSVWPYLTTTVIESLGGCLLGTVVALPLAIWIHRSRWVNAAVTPFLGATQAIPAIALAPLLVLWVGYGFVAIVLLCALMVFFPILVASVVGLRHVDAFVVDAARMDGADGLRLLTEIELPLALPNVLGGLRNGFALSVTGAVVGEMVMGGRGLGQLLTVQRDALDTTGMFATIAILGTLASLLYTLIHVIERRSRVMESLRPTSGR
ncbi:ABC transporter permease [Nigerium massiliense]|uniref:ABC transporter permease n=1 Tax=Nigerium massiliense TaxID=1522317 RepID=UPI000A9133A2|nr:ABC transporter permease [Nigerium massiliense]